MRSHAPCMLLWSFADFYLNLIQISLRNWDRWGGGAHRRICFDVSGYQIQHRGRGWRSTQPYLRTMQSCLWRSNQIRWIHCKPWNWTWKYDEFNFPSSSNLQTYIVTGGEFYGGEILSSTEILVKDGGSSWKSVAELPYKARSLRGVSLYNGLFIVTGEDIFGMAFLN